MLTHLITAACLFSTILAQLPPSYTLAKTNTTLSVRYGNIDVKPGQTLAYNVPTSPPTLSLPSSLLPNTTNTTTTYIALLIDPTANLSAPNPASLLWFQQSLSFSPSAMTSSPPQVPYLAPSTVNHAYLVLLYASPANFSIPADFPYKDSFRGGFNVSRVSVDFGTPLVAGTWFVLAEREKEGANCTSIGSGGSGGIVASGIVPSGIVSSGIVRSGFASSETGRGFATATATAGYGNGGFGHGMKGPVQRGTNLRLRG